MTARFFAPSGPLRGELEPPPDKSLSHRAAILGAMGSGPVVVRNYLHAEDTHSTLDAVRRLGARVEELPDHLAIHGVRLGEVPLPAGPIDVGNAGTLMRLLPGWLAAQPGRSYVLDGDASIRRRPVDRIAEPLRAMGAAIDARDGRYPPFTVHGEGLRGIRYALPVASAQVKSCVLLAGLSADGATSVVEPAPSRDHTERMLLAGGADVTRDGDAVSVRPGAALAFGELRVPADLSSAAFLIAAGVLVAGSRVRLRGVNVNWTRTGFLRILARMGGRVEGELEADDAPLTPGEPVSDLEVSAGALAATRVEAPEVPLAIDELPLVALLGCFAEGETQVTGAAELKVKESDRVATVVDGLRGLGAQIEATPDGFVVAGSPAGLRGGTLDAHGDHRLAMLGAVAGLASHDGVEVRGFEAAAVSYPRFADDLGALAAR
jgi:3-phosphoshikimate 1-carboxyvinyltransferase